MQPTIGSIVVYTFNEFVPRDRGGFVTPNAGLPPSPAVVIAPGPRATLRCLGEQCCDVVFSVPYSAEGAPHSWRWPHEHQPAE